MPLQIVSICESGVRPILALVQVDVTSNAEWDKHVSAMKRARVTLGADPGAPHAAAASGSKQAGATVVESESRSEWNADSRCRLNERNVRNDGVFENFETQAKANQAGGCLNSSCRNGASRVRPSPLGRLAVTASTARPSSREFSPTSPAYKRGLGPDTRRSEILRSCRGAGKLS